MMTFVKNAQFAWDYCTTRAALLHETRGLVDTAKDLYAEIPGFNKNVQPAFRAVFPVAITQHAMRTFLGRAMHVRQYPHYSAVLAVTTSALLLVAAQAL